MARTAIPGYHPSWLLLILLIGSLASLTGCSNKSSATRYAQAGANCFAKAVPTAGEGGLAWGSCMRYASRSGGTPKTCQVVMAKCK